MQAAIDSLNIERFKYSFDDITLTDIKNRFILENSPHFSIYLSSDPSIQLEIGYLYEYGITLEKDYSEAFKWYKFAADQNHSDAQYRIGKFYFHGYGVDKDEEEAYSWLKLSANLNNSNSFLYLSFYYSFKENVPDSLYWLKLSADHNNSQAQFILGYFYLIGRYVDKDENEGLNWLNYLLIKITHLGRVLLVVVITLVVNLLKLMIMKHLNGLRCLLIKVFQEVNLC